jgi:ElaB/YqjD/DUF883 family membrane-anchored ribosome-binding protein
MAISAENDALSEVRDDLNGLRKDISALVATLDKSARVSARNAAEQFSGGVREISNSAVDGGQQSAKMIGAWMEEKPVLAVLIAVGVGYFGLRAFLR